MDFYAPSNLQKFKNNNLVIERSMGIEDKIYTYEDVVNASEEIRKVLKHSMQLNHHRIAFQIDHSIALITVILGILNSSCSFCPISVDIDSEKIKQTTEKFKIKFLLTSTRKMINETQFQMLKEFKIFGTTIYLFGTNLEAEPNQIAICYSVQTSGSTGESKVVHVPLECIALNVESLSHKISITSTDVVLLGTPTTFDPFVIELFLALRNGSALLIPSKCMRQNLQLFAKEIVGKSPGATIIQMTPSVFKLFGKHLIQKEIFAESSTLRILILGGEPFPKWSNEVHQWQDWSSPIRKRVFNIYGITEISCWSTIHEIIGDERDVPLGDPIDNSIILDVRNLENGFSIYEGEGELFIGSQLRKCLINDENPEIFSQNKKLFRATGDLVVYNNKTLFYKNRLDDIVKIFGHRINLRKIENILLENENISEVCCVYWKKRNAFILFYKGSNPDEFEIWELMKNKLESYELPMDVMRVNSFPLSQHGKLSKFKLLELYRSRNAETVGNNASNTFKKVIENILRDTKCDAPEDTEVKRKRLSWSSSFYSAGGTSFQALQLNNQLEAAAKKTLPHVLSMLLDKNVSLAEILNSIKTEEESSQLDSNLLQNTLENYTLKVFWKFNLQKCVDASPSINVVNQHAIVSVGSHSHVVANIKVESGEILSILKCPDRIEGRVEFSPESYGFLGCYNGSLYKYDIETGNIVWEYDSKGMIKCKPLTMNGKIIFGNYSTAHNFFCLDIKNGEVIWSVKISTKGIYSSPVQIDENRIVICTLDGTVAALDIETQHIIWKKQLNSPIFSTSCILPTRKILVAEVTGNVICLDEEGNQICLFKVEGAIFSSFQIIHLHQDLLISFGCHDAHLYCLQVSERMIELKWKTRLQSAVFSTPTLVDDAEGSLIVACSTTGTVNIIDPNNGDVIGGLKLGGEIFSSPICLHNLILFGCRDNNLYCIKLERRSFMKSSHV